MTIIDMGNDALAAQNRDESSMNSNLSHADTLLSDAKVLENIAKDFVGGDLATGDFGKDVEDLAEVFAKEVATHLHAEAGEDALEGFVSTEESVVVAGVGNDDIRIGGLGSSIDELMLQGFETYTVLGLEG